MTLAYHVSPLLVGTILTYPALDCTATLPLVNSLNHFAYLASTSPRIREMVTLDGGLERLIHILRQIPRSLALSSVDRDPNMLADMQLNWKWSLAFQCVVNIGVRGSEAIRTRVVEAGMVPIIIKVLDNYLSAAHAIHAQQQHAVQTFHDQHSTQQETQRSIYPSPTPATVTMANSATFTPVPAQTQIPGTSDVDMNMDTIHGNDTTLFPAGTGEPRLSEESMGSNRVVSDASTSVSATTSECAEEMEASEDMDACDTTAEALATKSNATVQTPRAEASRVDMAQTPRAQQGSLPDETTRAQMWQTPTPTQPLPPPAPVQPPVFREEEILLSLQLLAYLSKYPHVRQFFHNADVREDMFFCPEWPEDTLPNRSWQPSDPVIQNVFSVAERFTHRPSRSPGVSGMLCSLYPRLAPEIQYWAGVVMRNACRKDESRGGIRQCANMLCGKWESYPREFAKCRRCRKAKYCSKQCQSKGWQMGHRYWCSARTEEDKARAASVSVAVPMPVPQPVPMQEEVPTTVAGPEPHVTPSTANTGMRSLTGHTADTGLPPMPTSGPTAAPVSHYDRPLGARHVPSTFTSEGPHLPSLRGVSAASIESNDLAEMSDDTTALTHLNDMPPQGGTGHHPFPPPIIAGDLSVHESDPATATLRAQEAQNVEENGPLDYVAAASWPPVVSPTVEPTGTTTDRHYDLGIRLPESSTTHTPGPTTATTETAPSTGFPLPAWHISPSVALRSVHNAARAVSSLLSTASETSEIEPHNGAVQASMPQSPTNSLFTSLHPSSPSPDLPNVEMSQVQEYR